MKWQMEVNNTSSAWSSPYIKFVSLYDPNNQFEFVSVSVIILTNSQMFWMDTA